MVSVVSGVLSQALWWFLGGDSYQPGFTKLFDSTPKPQLPTAHDTASHAHGSGRFHAHDRGRIHAHTQGKALYDVRKTLCDEDGCGGRELYSGCKTTASNQPTDTRHLLVEAKVDMIDPCSSWVILDTPQNYTSGLPSNTFLVSSWSARWISWMNIITQVDKTSAPALHWWENYLPHLDSSHTPNSTDNHISYSQVLEVASLMVPKESSPVTAEKCVCTESNQLSARPDYDMTNSEADNVGTELQINQELTSIPDKEFISRRQEDQKASKRDEFQNETSSNLVERNHSHELGEMMCRPDLPRRVPFKSRQVATLGNSSSRAGRWRWRRQCVRRSQSEDTLSILRRSGADSCVVDKMNPLSRATDTMNPYMLASVNDSTGTPGDNAPPLDPLQNYLYHNRSLPRTNKSRGDEGGHLRNRVTYREDIRAFDIYKITRSVGPGQYSRLPSPPAESDSDTDEGITSQEGFSQRKRRYLDERDARERKRHREEEEDAMMAMTTTPLLLPSSPSQHQRLKTLIKPTNAIPRLSSGTNNTYSPTNTTATVTNIASTTDTASSTNTDSTTNTASTCTSKREGDVGTDDTICDDNDEDDEVSTVVPEDFGNETDSDIEVLAQSESWVDLSNQPGSPDRVTPLPFGNGEEYLRLLREAQRESNQSSERVSLASSRRDTPRDSPHDSPKSPPNSPNTEMATDPEETVLKGVYINYYNKEGDFIRVEKNTETDWIWDWSSRPDQTPPKEWRFSHPRKGVSRGASIRRVMVGNSSLFSRDVLYTLLITNVLSLLLGTGIGIWLSKRSGGEVVMTLPIN
ncbi:hypothetical protein OTU49_016651 [Cherax quadricarinatus]|uniref:Uncharacterized protein n=1 Tax=Cherax quadricarinatus TaxID=27406 RepID=A0AAW0Y5Z7_CHEQU